MTCPCGQPLLTSWQLADGTTAVGFTLVNPQPMLVGTVFIVRGQCSNRYCRTWHTVKDPEAILRNGILRIPVTKQESVAHVVKVRR